MKVLIQTPSSKIYQGEVSSIYIKTPIGEAEVLDGHASFSALIQGKIKLKEKKGDLKEIDLGEKSGIFHTDGQNVFILIP